MDTIIEKATELASTTDGLIVIVIALGLLFLAFSVAKKLLKLAAVSAAAGLGIFMIISYIETGSIDNVEVPESVKDAVTNFTERVSEVDFTKERNKIASDFESL